MPPDPTILRVLVVDDEPIARRRLKRLLERAARVEIVAECGDGLAALAAIREHRPDVVFLDVQMPGLNGFEVLRALDGSPMPVVVFVTAFDRFALQAFEAHAIDYLLKPLSEERVGQALVRAQRFLRGGTVRARHQGQLAEMLRATTGPIATSCLFVRRGDRVLVLQPRDVDWVEAESDYVRLHVGLESHLMRSTLNEMERRLQPEGFVRIHRSRLVNLDRVKELRPLSRGESVVLLKSGERLDASYAFLKTLQEQPGSAS